MRRLAPLLVVLLAGCGSAADTQATPDRTPAARTAPATTTPAKTVECVPVEQALLDQIGSQAEGTTLALTAGQAYRSPDYESVYFVAAKLGATGVEDELGVWATNNITPGQSGSIMAVDGIAQQFTAWTDADQSGAEISKADPAVAVVKGCVS